VTWRSVDGSAVGTSHLESNVPCQDRCVTATLGDGTIFVAALADGAGSAACAERGADLVCAALLDAVAQSVNGSHDLGALDDETVRAWFAAARERIVAEAAGGDRDVREYAATALLCVAGDDHTICAQLGDGGIVVRDAAGDYTVAIWPENGEYANQTFFITDDDALDRVAVDRRARVDDVAVFSDGLTRLALDHGARAAFRPFFEPILRTVRESARTRDELRADLVAFLGSDTVNERTDDDKALAAATRTAGCA